MTIHLIAFIVFLPVIYFVACLIVNGMELLFDLLFRHYYHWIERFNYSYQNAKQKHLDEYLHIYLYIARYTLNTRIKTRRAYMSIFTIDRCLFGVHFGIGYRGVQMIIKDHMGDIYYGKRCPLRAKRWHYDIGIAGMCDASLSPLENLHNELHEEFGLDYHNMNIKFHRTLTPHHGASCIIDVYHASCVLNCQPVSLDGTYVSIHTLRKSHCKEDFLALKFDGGQLTKTDTYCLFMNDCIN